MGARVYENTEVFQSLIGSLKTYCIECDGEFRIADMGFNPL